MALTHTIADGIAEITVSRPPVNALDVASWFALAECLKALGDDDRVRVVILAADGRGFNAGVDIKEMQRSAGHDALIDANRGCAAAFAAVYDCPVPVVVAVHGYCLGGGIGLVGNADVLVATRDSSFGLPEVDRGALGAATHLMRLVPALRARAMLYTCARATGEELHGYGSIARLVDATEELLPAAREIAASIAAKRPAVIRAAKACLNGIDPIDVKRSYRFEQGFTFELNLSGDGDAAREAFVRGESAD